MLQAPERNQITKHQLQIRQAFPPKPHGKLWQWKSTALKQAKVKVIQLVNVINQTCFSCYNMSKSLLPVTKRWLWRVKPWHSCAQDHPVKVELAILHQTDDDLCTVPLTGFRSLEAERQWSRLNVLRHWGFAQLLHPAWQVADRRDGGPMSSLFKFWIATRCLPVTSDQFAKGDPTTNKSSSHEHGGIQTPLLH